MALSCGVCSIRSAGRPLRCALVVGVRTEHCQPTLMRPATSAKRRQLPLRNGRQAGRSGALLLWVCAPSIASLRSCAWRIWLASFGERLSPGCGDASKLLCRWSASRIPLG
jgi:hypothetical protein